MPAPSVPRRLPRAFGAALVGLYLGLDALLGPLFRPLARLLRRLPVLETMARGVARLPPVGALVVLGLPFLVAEPAKIFGLYLVGRGHWALGVLTVAAAYLISLLIVDRIYEAGRPALMRIVWFAALIGWLTELRDRFAALLRGTRMWRLARIMVARLRQRFARLRRAM